MRHAAKSVNLLFLVSVVVPTTVAAIYYGFIASDIYISETRFILRTQQRPIQGNVLGDFLQGVGMTRAQEEAHAVEDFILSRDALRRLDERLAVRKSFSSRDIDLPNRFGFFDFGDKSFEALYRYYLKRVTVSHDNASSIITLRASAFTPEDALHINEHLLAMSEELVNQLNKRAHEDALRFASTVVHEAELRAENAALALSAFRTSRSVFDPDRQSALQLQGASKLQEELIATKTLLEQVTATSPNNPQVAILKLRVEALQRAVDAEVNKVTGRGPSLSAKASEYERLSLERTFAEKQLGAALASLELARQDAQKKQLYLERIVQPHMPDHALEPRRIRSTIIVLVIGLMAWGVLSLLISSVREHFD